jgi:uroporphyrin-III C-methyltransferase / precorrin-2 dehydrogenase / sirohydrochlorin ferrochelatase
MNGRRWEIHAGPEGPSSSFHPVVLHAPPTEVAVDMSDTAQGCEQAADLAPDLYPVFLKLAGRKVLVVGGGHVARAKLCALLTARAAITVVAPRILPEIFRLGVRCIRREFRPSDLDGAWYVVSAAPAHVNRCVAQFARKQRLFVNAVDDAERASCYLGSVVRKGGVTLAISTQGRLPALAGLLREAFEVLIPDDIEQWLLVGQAARQKWKELRVPHEQRRPLLLHAINEIYAAYIAPAAADDQKRQSMPSR